MKRALAIAVVLALYAFAQKQEPLDSPARVARWKEDLKSFRAGVSAPGTTFDTFRGISSKGQKDFPKLYPPTTFDPAMEALEAQIPKASDGDMVLGIMRLWASANVAHNSVETPLSMGFFPRLPLRFQWFLDGLAVTAASSDYKAALGAHVIRIGGQTPEEITTALSPYISHENDVWLRYTATEFIRMQAVLEHLNLLESGALALTLQKPGAEPFTLSIKPADPRTPLLTFAEELHTPVSLSRRHPEKFYWSEFLPDSETLYIQYNACRKDPNQPFDQFAAQLFKDAEAHVVKRVVLDLRFNGGGDTRIVNPLKSGLAARRKTLGPLFLLIGPNTFSAALDNAIDFHANLHATLVGEPAGGRPGGYGEVKKLTLPHSKLVIRFTSKNFGHENEPPLLQPDHTVGRTLSDALSGKDPALEAILTGSVPPK